MAGNNDLTLRVGFDIDKFAKDLSKSTAMLDKFGKNAENALKGFVAVSTLKSLGEFVLNVSKLSGEAQGVSEAFNKLENSTALMLKLKTATGGTVDELQLMKRAVMASNFDISLKALPQLLEFATLRAKQTGQSVDYLVDSIVTGIGRKSKLILDNLGISAVQLTEALGGASAASSTIGEVADAVGKIASANLEKMGRLSENAATKMERMNASWENTKVVMGDVANGTGVLGAVVQKATQFMDVFAAKTLSFYEKFIVLTTFGAVSAEKALFEERKRLFQQTLKDELKLIQIRKEADRFENLTKSGVSFEAAKKAFEQNIYFREIMAELAKRELEDAKKKDAAIQNEANLTELLNEKKAESLKLTGASRAAINKEIKSIEEKISALQKLGTEQNKIDVSSGPAMKEPNKTWFGDGPMKRETYFGDGPMFDEEGWQKQQDEMEQMARTAARIGDTIGQSFGDMATGAKTFGEAMGEMASSAIDALERYVLAQMIANSAKFGPVGIAMAAVGFGLVKSLFRQIGKDNSGGPSGSGLSNSQFNTSRGGGGMHITGRLVAQGSQLVAVLDNQNRNDGRTKVSYSS